MNTEALITHTFPLEGFAQAYDIARHWTGGAMKVMLEVHEQGSGARDQG